MSFQVKRVYVEKKQGFNVEAMNIMKDLKENYLLDDLEVLRIMHRYDVEGLDDNSFEDAKKHIFSETNVDHLYNSDIDLDESLTAFAVQYLPGQFDQRADSAKQCLQLIAKTQDVIVRYAKIIVLNKNISLESMKKVKDFFINPVESMEVSMALPKSLALKVEEPKPVETIDGFIEAKGDILDRMVKELGLAMNTNDLLFCQKYFKEEEERNPTITEIRVIDTYWSDHCRHTTFLTNIEKVTFEDENSKEYKTYQLYLKARENLYSKEKPITLMNLATIAVKELRKEGYLKEIDQSEEINACSINVDVEIGDAKEKWLLMFKNETHNHPTEIEPFGGAATCLGGAIRDPLSGRSYVYQAMRVTGAKDPTEPVDKAILGKLPQRTITKGACKGYSSYGNQIGLATGQVKEIYHDGYVAKRMEIGAVIGAAPLENVRRERPVPGDIIVLLGGRTGRDGCGGATGSSKEHTEESLETCGAEVQKGNPPTERKIQRLFRKNEVTTMIKRCNDFGAGGVSVAIGELSDGLDINLDLVPKKYEGLDGTELAISESQERMAVVIDPKDEEAFIKLASQENLEATTVAKVTDLNTMRMFYKGDCIVSLKRTFLDSNGASQYANVHVTKSEKVDLNSIKKLNKDSLEEDIKEFLSDLNMCSQKGLVEHFDSTIGAGTILMPYGGKYQLTPEQGMACLLPHVSDKMKTTSLMTYGYNPFISKQDPYLGAMYAVVESVSKIVAMGGDNESTYLTFQEYFEKLGNDKEKWGKPFKALLGAYQAQRALNIAAIGGKDSMSGTFMDIDVPPTLVSFAVDTTTCDDVMSSEIKNVNSKLYVLETKYLDNGEIDFDTLKKNYKIIKELIKTKKVLSVRAILAEGILGGLFNMAIGNKIGVSLNECELDYLTEAKYGSFLIESKIELEGEFISEIGKTNSTYEFSVNGLALNYDCIIPIWENKLEKIFRTKANIDKKDIKTFRYENKSVLKPNILVSKPTVFIPVFPGTNCEYDSTMAFERAGANVKTVIFKNLNNGMIKESVREFKKAISESQMIMFPGGFSAGDEPEGSGKFIANVFRNPYLKEAVTDLLDKRDGLVLGICNGFQALIKLGLLPYGEISEMKEDQPTLTFNRIGRHVSLLTRTRIASNKSPWLMNSKVDDIVTVPVSHGEGRFYASDDVVKELEKNGQIATQYVDLSNSPTYDTAFNPNGSVYAIEGITSKDGRVLGKMGHSERVKEQLYKNFEGNFDSKIFESGVKYFK